VCTAPPACAPPNVAKTRDRDETYALGSSLSRERVSCCLESLGPSLALAGTRPEMRPPPVVPDVTRPPRYHNTEEYIIFE
jgi:hypothetical protein